MATKKKAAPQEEGGEVLKKTAKAIGSALGTIAAKTGIAHPEPSPKPGKLVKKNKKRLPRKEKKRLLKAAGKTAQTAPKS